MDGQQQESLGSLKLKLIPSRKGNKAFEGQGHTQSRYTLVLLEGTGQVKVIGSLGKGCVDIDGRSGTSSQGGATGRRGRSRQEALKGTREE